MPKGLNGAEGCREIRDFAMAVPRAGSRGIGRRIHGGAGRFVWVRVLRGCVRVHRRSAGASRRQWFTRRHEETKKETREVVQPAVQRGRRLVEHRGTSWTLCLIAGRLNAISQVNRARAVSNYALAPEGPWPGPGFTLARCYAHARPACPSPRHPRSLTIMLATLARIDGGIVDASAVDKQGQQIIEVPCASPKLGQRKLSPSWGGIGIRGACAHPFFWNGSARKGQSWQDRSLSTTCRT
ncbi:hypothetical protein BH23GEM8_BH23GEM8_21850 [soil metagenome]